MSSRNESRSFLESLAPYRLPSAHSNFAYRVPLENRWIFLKIYGPKKPRSKYEIRQFLGRMGLRQPVEYRSPEERQSFEQETLRHWKETGFTVPEVIDAPFPELSALPHLATTFVEGPTLREQLSRSRLSPEDKKVLLSALFDEVARRHDRAFAENDRWLFHIDANTRTSSVRTAAMSAVWISRWAAPGVRNRLRFEGNHETAHDGRRGHAAAGAKDSLPRLSEHVPP